MSILHRRRGEKVLLANDVSLTVLDINYGEVKLGMRTETSSQDSAALHNHLANVRRARPCYYLFPQGGPRTLVVRCEQGKSLSFNGTAQLTVLRIVDGVVTLKLNPSPLYDPS